MSFFFKNRVLFFTFFFFLNMLVIFYVFMATKHFLLERDIATIKKNYSEIAKENENIKINLKITSENKILFNEKKTTQVKKNIKEIPIVTFF